MANNRPPWQQTLWQRLAQQWHQLPPAMILAGPKGLGKRQLAADIVAGLLCHQAGPQACGQCASCHWLNTHHHGDLLSLSSRQLQVDSIRQSQLFLRQTPLYGSARVLLLDGADQLTVAAANSLLKIIEEPPAKAWLVLIADQWRTLPMTLRSRCPIHRLVMPDWPTALAWLGELANKDQWLALAGGMPYLAQRYAQDNPELLVLRQQRWQQWYQLSCGQGDPITLAEQWTSQHYDLTLRWLLSWQQDALSLTLQQPILNQDLQGDLQQYSQQHAPEQFIQWYQHLHTLWANHHKPFNHSVLLSCLLCQVGFQ